MAEFARDARYHFQYPPDFVTGMGRLALAGSYLEGVVAVMLMRLVDNRDLEVGRRLAADATFRALVDQVRALSAHRLPQELHARIDAWLTQARAAYADRSKIVHADLGVSIRLEGPGPEYVWVRSSVRGAQFQQTVTPATAERIHEVARELERCGLEGVHLMDPVQNVVGHPQSLESPAANS